MVILEAAEMYMETILILGEKLGCVHAADVAREMGYSRPTVSEQMKKFRQNGYVEQDGEGHIRLTDAGRAIAERTYERHNVIARIFVSLGVSGETAHRDACRVEHYISDETFACMKRHFEKDRDINGTENKKG